MATILIDGFDDYGPSGVYTPSLSNSLSEGGWSIATVYTQPNIVNGLAGVGGYAIQFNNNIAEPEILSKTLPANYTRIIGGFKFSGNLLTYAGCAFVDNTTTQCSIVVNSISGFITIKQGSNGNTLGQSSVSIASNSVHEIEFDITFGNPGSWSVALDGVVCLSGSGVTQQSSNNYINVFQFAEFGVGGAGNGICNFDDLYLFDDTTSFNNSMLLSNPVVFSEAPIGDQQTEFTNLGNVFGNIYSTYYYEFSGGYNTGNNTLYLTPFIPNVNCTIEFIVINGTNAPGTSYPSVNFKGVIYADNGGVPGTLLSTGTQVTGINQSQQLELPLTSPQSLTAGVTYWLGFINDTNAELQQFNGSSTGYVATNTYSSGAPSTAPTMTGGQTSLYMFGLCVNASTNWESVALQPPIGDLSSVASPSVGIGDFYVFAALSTSTQTVYSVAVRANARLTYAGSHTFDLVVSSNSTQGNGSNTNINPTLNYAWYSSYFDVDPNTGSSWTVASTNAAYAGMKIVS